MRERPRHGENERQRQTEKRQEIGVAMLVYLKGPHSQYKRGMGEQKQKASRVGAGAEAKGFFSILQRAALPVLSIYVNCKKTVLCQCAAYNASHLRTVLIYNTSF